MKPVSESEPAIEMLMGGWPNPWRNLVLGNIQVIPGDIPGRFFRIAPTIHWCISDLGKRVQGSKVNEVEGEEKQGL